MITPLVFMVLLAQVSPCKVHIDPTIRHHPIVFLPRGNGSHTIVLPTGFDPKSGYVVYDLPWDTSDFDLRCTGSSNYFEKYHDEEEDGEEQEEQTLNLRCIPFNPSQAYMVLTRGCKRRVKPSIVRKSETVYDVGFRLAPGHFHSIYELQVDPSTLGTVRVMHNISSSSAGHKQIDSRRPKFKSSNLIYGPEYSKDVKRLYRARNILHRVVEVYGQNVSKRYVGENRYVRGHLAPDSDFVLLGEQDATYLLANVVPQLQVINNGIWKTIENEIRHVTEHLNCRHMQVTTRASKEVLFYLDGEQRRIPVPRSLSKQAKCLDEGKVWEKEWQVPNAMR